MTAYNNFPMKPLKWLSPNEKLAKFYKKLPPQTIESAKFLELTKDKENRPDAECLFDCYEQNDNVYVRKKAMIITCMAPCVILSMIFLIQMEQ